MSYKIKSVGLFLKFLSNIYICVYICSITHILSLKGGYSCECKKGFKKIKGRCVDVDECATGEAKCPGNKICINQEVCF